MWNKRKSRLISLLLLAVIIFTPIESYGQSQGLDLDYFYEIIDTAKDKYVEDYPIEFYLESALKGLFKDLDPHSQYYNREEFSRLNESISGNFVGIGVYITEEENGFMRIVRPIEGSPAEKAGILPNDIIITVDGRPIRGRTSDEVVNMIKGEKGTVVKLRVRRDGYQKIIPVVRDSIQIDPVKYQIIDDIGYIELQQFNQNAHIKMLKALEYMAERDISKIILDLRDNPGGYLSEAIYIANFFVPKGPVVHIKYRNDKIETYKSYLEEVPFELVVLVNENSASASEILAAAIKDSKAGQILGVTTYGKGTVQELVSLPRGDGLKITIAEYLSPKMNKIDGVGVRPDILVENIPGEDTQLKEAFNLLKD